MKKPLFYIACLAPFMAPLALGLPSGEAIRQPSSALEAPLSKEEAPRSVYKSAPAALLARVQARWARFRPVSRMKEALALTGREEALRNPMIIEMIFDEEMSRRVREQYMGTVAPLERLVNDPSRRASLREIEQYHHRQAEMAEWTLKQVGEDQLKDLIKRGDRSSGTMQVISVVKELSSSNKEKDDPVARDRAYQRQAQEERLASAARGEKVAQEEPAIPTRLRTKMNVLKRYGQLTFQNPLAVATVEGRMGSGDNLAVEVKREFRNLRLDSKVRYVVDDSRLIVNVNKRITDEVAVDLNSERYTGSKTGTNGVKKRETARVTYSLSF